ncbi:unnamed protein product [Caenorhabditis auriculariae]|uniref:Uncharacterized protein n=1 Tax=Caenorhabditis auriculariae TaxID=2777116 RepID=A0A8S1HZ74_9PELO|nr:unnamed protein product [Caenorhabditis auriculariae]
MRTSSSHDRNVKKFLPVVEKCKSKCTLLQLSQIALGHNLTAIGNVGLCPYSLIKPILEKRTVVELRSFLSCNPGLEEDSDELFEKFVKRHPLCSSTLQIGRETEMSRRSEAADFGRQTLYKGKKMDTGRKGLQSRRRWLQGIADVRITLAQLAEEMTTPTAKDISMARRAVAAGDKTKLSALPQAFVYNSVNPGKLNAKQKSTNAPLMKKTMMMMKLMRR